MHQHPCFTTAWTSCYDDAVRLLVGDNLHLCFRQQLKQLLIFLRCEIPFYFSDTLTFEILSHKVLVICLEVILHILQCRIIISHHQIGIFANDMNLLNFLLVEFVQHSVVFLLVSEFAVFYSANVHSVVEHQKSAFEFQRTNF